MWEQISFIQKKDRDPKCILHVHYAIVFKQHNLFLYHYIFSNAGTIKFHLV